MVAQSSYKLQHFFFILTFYFKIICLPFRRKQNVCDVGMKYIRQCWGWGGGNLKRRSQSTGQSKGHCASKLSSPSPDHKPTEFCFTSEGNCLGYLLINTTVTCNPDLWFRPLPSYSMLTSQMPCPSLHNTSKSLRVKSPLVNTIDLKLYLKSPRNSHE